MTISELCSSIHDEKLELLFNEFRGYFDTLKINGSLGVEILYDYVPCTDAETALTDNAAGHTLSVELRAPFVDTLYCLRAVIDKKLGAEAGFVRSVNVNMSPKFEILNKDEYERIIDSFVEVGEDYYVLVLRSKWGSYEYRVPIPVEAVYRLFEYTSEHGLDESLINK